MPGFRTAALCAVLAAIAFVNWGATVGHAQTVPDPDRLVHMPGSQPGQVTMHGLSALDCAGCHVASPASPDPVGNAWQGSMMAQAARDPIFWACLTVANQDSVWAYNAQLSGQGLPLGSLATADKAKAADICLRCHTPTGWLNRRSTATNGADLDANDDFDGVTCENCHRMIDPFYQATYAGTREGADWAGYWDENQNFVEIAAAATAARDADRAEALGFSFLNGLPFYAGDAPAGPYAASYLENGAGQYFMENATTANRPVVRGPFADVTDLAGDGRHAHQYSRYHKSRFFCATCHDVSNPTVANLANPEGLPDNSGGQDLLSEQFSAHRYTHVERTFSEFMLSAYAAQGGAATNPAILAAQPTIARAAKCQDCHMRDVAGSTTTEGVAVTRPAGSQMHPGSGLPLHDLTGGNLWITSILASTWSGSANYDPTNAGLLNGRADSLVMDTDTGVTKPEDTHADILAAAARAGEQLRMAGSIVDARYNRGSGRLGFKVLNNTGHKLISGFLEGRRMWVNVKAYAGGQLLHEVNPYDNATGTLKGVTPSAPQPGANERHVDQLVYECQAGSTLTGEAKTFHFALATSRVKDNRIPPKGFDVASAAARLSEPVYGGESAPDYYSAAEYAGGYDEVALDLPPGADRVEITLYYQGTSKEYVEFLRDEINGDGARTLPDVGGQSAYIVQTDPFFAGMRGWGDAIHDLWRHNHGLDGQGRTVNGVVPFAMAEASASVGMGLPQLMLLLD